MTGQGDDFRTFDGDDPPFRAVNQTVLQSQLDFGSNTGHTHHAIR